MKKTNVIIAATLALVAVAGSISASAQYPLPPEGRSQTVTPKQLERCKDLGVPKFTCTEQTLLAAERINKVKEKEAYGSGTPMFGTNFGEMGLFIGVLAAIFGGVATTFFARARIGKKVPI